MSPSLTSSCLRDSSNSAAKFSSWLLSCVAIETMRYASAFRPDVQINGRSGALLLVPRLARGFGLSATPGLDHSRPAQRWKGAEISFGSGESQSGPYVTPPPYRLHI